jgi:hypothetical protein
MTFAICRLLFDRLPTMSMCCVLVIMCLCPSYDLPRMYGYYLFSIFYLCRIIPLYAVYPVDCMSMLTCHLIACIVAILHCLYVHLLAMSSSFFILSPVLSSLSRLQNTKVVWTSLSIPFSSTRRSIHRLYSALISTVFPSGLIGCNPILPFTFVIR